jgi:ferredoxin-NADP reductase
MTTVYTEHLSELVVVDRTDVAQDVVSVTLAAPDDRELPAWTPGAHVDLLLAPDLVRQYSLCGAPADRTRWRIGVLRDERGRGGSRHVHDTLRQGSRVQVRGPRNHFPLAASPSYVFVAGGIGITPLLPMVAQAQAVGADWRLHYGGRRRASMAFVDELAAYDGRVELWPEDERGMLDLDGILGQPLPGTLVYTCGPEGLLQAVESRCAAWPSGSLHVERFAAKPVDDAAAATSFEVVCQRSGITVTVPEDTSVLDAVSAAGVSVLSSCLEGVCGTCETAVVEGVPDHRDSLLTDDEKAAGDYMMICVSRCTGPRLVLDL